ncbi:MAG: TetR/AcrR family transcriptional regulator [Sphingopyxis sp.]
MMTAQNPILPAHGARRTQTQRRDESEQRLLVAAAQLIEAEGFSAVTFGRVGALAGYSRGLAAHKFGSKDGLVRAVIAFVQGRVQAGVDARVAHIASPAARLLAWQDELLQQVESDPLVRAYFVMMAAAVGNRADVRDAFLAAHEAVRATLRAMVEDGQAAGEIDPAINADATALSIGAQHLGISVELLLDPQMDVGVVRRTLRAAVARALGMG